MRLRRAPMRRRRAIGIAVCALLCTSAFAATSARAAYPGQNGKIYFEACDAGCS